MIALASDTKGPSATPATNVIEPVKAVPTDMTSVAPLQQQQLLQWQPVDQRRSFQNAIKSPDAATELFVLGQHQDPAMQFLLSQSGGPQRVPSQLDDQMLFHPQQQQQQTLNQQAMSLLHQQPKPRHQQNQIFAYGDGSQQVPSFTATSTTPSSSSCTMPAKNGTGVASSGSLNIWQQIQAQKKEEAQMVHLRKMMALNLLRQQNRGASSAKNFRASAA